MRCKYRDGSGYAVIHRASTAPNATVRANRLAMLERGEAPHPQ